MASSDPDAGQDLAGLQRRLRDVEEKLREAEETIAAIRSGDVDAIVVHGRAGPQVYTLENDDRPYRRLIEQIGEGALTLTAGWRDAVLQQPHGRRCWACRRRR